MAGHDFHPHGAHEHEVEHQAQHGVSLAQYIAIFTAILSSIAAVVSYHGSSMQNEALLLKNEAVIKQNQASNTWAFYQSKSNKQHIAELASQLVPAEKSRFYEEEAARYMKEKTQIRQQAEALEKASADINMQSEKLTASHHKESQGMMFLQIAISLASITVLTRKKWLFILAGISAVIGIVLSVMAWLL